MSWDSSMGTAVLTGAAYPYLLFTVTWELNFVNGFVQWQNITSAQSPPPSYGSALVDDPSGHGVLLFGGFLVSVPVGGPFALNETWLLKNGAWYNETPPGASPGARGGAAAAFVESDNCPVIFGGDTGVGHEYQDTWTFGCSTVTFSEVGLPVNQSWNVELNNTVYNTTEMEITFYLGDGLYPFTMGPGPTLPAGEQYEVLPHSGAVFVSGIPVIVNVSYQPQYMVVVEVSNNLEGWVSQSGGWVNANLSYWVNATSTYWVNATPNAGFTFLHWEGSGTGSYTGTNATAMLIADSPITELAVFSPIVRYPLDFEESGLPAGSNWSVELNGTTLTSSNRSINVYLQNGTYYWRIPSIAGSAGRGASAPNVTSGVTIVNGGRKTVSVTFSEQSGSGSVFSLSDTDLLILLALVGGIAAISLAAVFYRRRERRDVALPKT
jgi:hypothetical protein